MIFCVWRKGIVDLFFALYNAVIKSCAAMDGLSLSARAGILQYDGKNFAVCAIMNPLV